MNENISNIEMHEAHPGFVSNLFHTREVTYPAKNKDSEKDAIIRQLQMQLDQARANAAIIAGPEMLPFSQKLQNASQVQEALWSQLKYSLQFDDDYKLKLESVKNLHEKVITTISTIESNTIKTVNERDAEMLSHLDARLKAQEEQYQLAAIQTQRDTSNDTLETKYKLSISDLHKTQGLALFFETQLTTSQTELYKLKSAYKNLQLERDDILKELALTRRELKLLKPAPVPPTDHTLSLPPVPSQSAKPAETVPLKILEQTLKDRKKIQYLERQLKKNQIEYYPIDVLFFT